MKALLAQVGLVVECDPVEGNDKLKKVTVDVGGAEPIVIVTNAANVSDGSRIVVAMVSRDFLPLVHSTSPSHINLVPLAGRRLGQQ